MDYIEDYTVSTADAEKAAKLQPQETWWADRRDLLASKGYKLRPRFQPGWKAPWMPLKKGKEMLYYGPGTPESIYWNPKFLEFEDIIDAVDENGNAVYVRHMREDSEELAMLTELSSLSMRAQSGDTVATIRDRFEDPEDPAFVFVVTDLLHRANHPHHRYLEDAMEFFEQLLEIIVFHHSIGISNLLYQDCMVMRTNGMFYKGFHPIEQDLLPDGSDWAPHRPHQACAVRYMLRDLRYAVKNKGVDDPLGPGCDMDQFARQLDWLKHDTALLFGCGVPSIRTFWKTVKREKLDARTALTLWREVRRKLWYINRWRPMDDRFASIAYIH